MKHAILICCAIFMAACSFDPGGLPAEGPDAGSDTDADTGPDAGGADTDPGADADPGTDAMPPAATIVCTTETIDGYPKLVLTFGGDIASGFLGSDPGTVQEYIAYGSNQEDLAVTNSCNDTWSVPYPPACNKHVAAWNASPRLLIEPEVDYLNVALVHAGGTVRWGDLKTSDGDSIGFLVSGSGTVSNGAFDCRVELVDGGTGGYIRTKP